MCGKIRNYPTSLTCKSHSFTGWEVHKGYSADLQPHEQHVFSQLSLTWISEAT